MICITPLPQAKREKAEALERSLKLDTLRAERVSAAPTTLPKADTFCTDLVQAEAMRKNRLKPVIKPRMQSFDPAR